MSDNIGDSSVVAVWYLRSGSHSSPPCGRSSRVVAAQIGKITPPRQRSLLGPCPCGSCWRLAPDRPAEIEIVTVGQRAGERSGATADRGADQGASARDGGDGGTATRPDQTPESAVAAIIAASRQAKGDGNQATPTTVPRCMSYYSSLVRVRVAQGPVGGASRCPSSYGRHGLRGYSWLPPATWRTLRWSASRRSPRQ